MDAKARRLFLKRLNPVEADSLARSWRYFLARPEQLAPGTPGAANPRDDWTFWLRCAGRGEGKTRAGAEWVIEEARENPGIHIALVGATADDVRSIMLSAGREHLEGASGILAVSPDDFRPVHEPSKRMLTWPNGTVATAYSADEPDRLRGPQHHRFWVDEIAAWMKLQGAWDMLLFGLRLGEHPRGCITTTPRPVPLLKELLKDPRTVVSRGTTYDNRENLARAFFESVIRKYEGTRLGRQEIDAEVLEDIEGALWKLGDIDAGRVHELPPLVRVVVAIDPAMTSNKDSDETGIVVAGRGEDGRCYVLADGSGKHTPNAWAREAVALYRRFEADRIIGEVNNGGDLVETNIRTVDAKVPYKAVHASRGKATRAEPVVALYEQGKVRHYGTHPKLEDQMTTWDPNSSKSPDRVDSLTYAITELMLTNQPSKGALALPSLEQENIWAM